MLEIYTYNVIHVITENSFLFVVNYKMCKINAEKSFIVHLNTLSIQILMKLNEYINKLSICCNISINNTL